MVGKKSNTGTLINENQKLQRVEYEDVAGYWDHYVAKQFNQMNEKVEYGRPKYKFPGDEWANPQFWAKVIDELFVKNLPCHAQYLVEIGPGSGKYSLLVLDQYKDAKLKCFDISAQYLNVLKKRCKQSIDQGRLEPVLMDNDYRFLYNQLVHSQWIGKVDCLFSIDSMVHVDLQYLIVYWITAALSLRKHGKLIMSVADPTTDVGFTKLLSDIPEYYPLQGKPSDKFEWLSADLVQSVLSRLGFEKIEFSNLDRNLWFVATLTQKREVVQW